VLTTTTGKTIARYNRDPASVLPPEAGGVLNAAYRDEAISTVVSVGMLDTLGPAYNTSCTQALEPGDSSSRGVHNVLLEFRSDVE
jgi:hypothetical protein